MEEMKVQVIKPTKTLLDSSRDTSEKLKVCAYCRVSTKDEEQKESFRNQIKYYTDLIKSHKEWKNAGIYADEGISGTSDDKRPQFMQMIQDAMEGKINIILVKSLSRFPETPSTSSTMSEPCVRKRSPSALRRNTSTH